MVEPIKSNICASAAPLSEEPLSPLACYDPETSVTVTDQPIVMKKEEQHFSWAKRFFGTTSFVGAGCSPYYEEELCEPLPTQGDIIKQIDLSDLNNLPENHKNRLIKILKTIPTRYLSGIKQLKIEDHFESTQWFQGYGSRELQNAAIKLPGGVIAVRRDYVESDDLEMLYDLRDSVIHEVGHLAAERLSVDRRHIWAELHQESRMAKSLPSTYSGTSAVEDFAEFFQIFLTRSDIIFMGAVQDPVFQKKYNFFVEHVFCFENTDFTGFNFFSTLLNENMPDEEKESLYRSWMEQVAYFSITPEMNYEIAKIRRKHSLRSVNVEEALTYFAKALEHKPAFNGIPGEDYIHISDHGIYEYRFTPVIDFLNLFEEQITDPKLAGQLAEFLEYYVDRLAEEDPDLPYLHFRSHLLRVLVDTTNFFVADAFIWENQESTENGIRETIYLGEQFARLWWLAPENQRQKHLTNISEQLPQWTANMVGTGDGKVAEIFLKPLLVELKQLIEKEGIKEETRSLLRIRLGEIAGWLAESKVEDLWEDDNPELEISLLSYLEMVMDNLSNLNNSSTQLDVIAKALRQTSDYFITRFVDSGGAKAIPSELAGWIDAYFYSAPSQLQNHNSAFDRLQTAALLTHAISDPPGMDPPEMYTAFREDDGTFSQARVAFFLVDFSFLVAFAETEKKGRALEIARTHLQLLADPAYSPLPEPFFYLAYSELGSIFQKEELPENGSVWDLYCSNSDSSGTCRQTLRTEAFKSFIKAYQLFYSVPAVDQPESSTRVRDNINSLMDIFLADIFEANPEEQGLLVELNFYFQEATRSETIPIEARPFLYYHRGRIFEAMGDDEAACSVWREGNHLGVINGDTVLILNALSANGC